MFDLVLFDLDGTLVDSAPDIVQALNATLAEAGLPTHPPAAVRGFVGDGAAKLIERALSAARPPEDGGWQPGALAARVDDLMPHFQAHYAAHLCDETKVYQGIPELLEALKARGASMAVLTNKPVRLAQDLVSALGLSRYFARVVGDGAGFPRKPDPTAARALIADLGAQAETTLMVGDGIPDAKLAAALPCKGLGAAWGYSAPHALLAAGASALVERPADVLLHLGG
jgi:phosphoglycolate phosphatase